jgi:transcription-repair coupling factor (superfamily II helicase)
MRLKIDLYRRLARVSNLTELADFRAELVDRFGAPPPLVQHLLTMAEIRIAAHRWRITSIHLENQFAVFTYTSARLIQQLAARSGGQLRIVDTQSAYLPLNTDVAADESVVADVKALLQQE